MSIYRLIYRSRATAPVDEQLIQEITDVSIENNRRFGVTGILLATSSHFLQVLEGSIESVNGAFHNIARDSRHDEVILISYGRVPQREFADWTMRGTGVGLLGRWIGDRLQEKYGQEEGELLIPLEEERALELLRDVASYLRASG